MTSAPNCRRIFVSYSHRDAEWLRQLQTHLRPFERAGLIDHWDDTRLRPGDAWEEEIRQALSEARVAVLLVSPHFLASDFIMDQELPLLLEAARRGEATLLPMILSPCRYWAVPGLSTYQAVNDPARPLVDCSVGDRERAWVKLVEAVEGLLRPPGKRAWAAAGAGPTRTNKLALRVGRRNLCLLAMTEVRLGKQRGNNDIVLRALPATPANVDRTEYLSRQHAILSLTERGAVWRNLDCANGTVVGGQSLPGLAEVLLQNGVVICPAGALSLRCELDRESPLLGQEEAYRDLAGPGAEFAGPPPRGAVSGVRLRRLDLPDLGEEYLLVRWGALFGDDPRCALRAEGAAPVHARLLHLGGAFWLEPAPGEALEMAGVGVVPDDQLVPLRPGQEFRAGAARLVVASFGQWFLDVDPPA
jgi:hypothetical protein